MLLQIQRYSILFALQLLLLPPMTIWADQQVSFDRVDLGKGTIQHEIVDIVQDRDGYMWFASRIGLIRYDGYFTKVYRHRPDDPNSLSSSTLHKLCVDIDNRIWISSRNGAIDRLDPRSDDIVRFCVDSPADSNADDIQILSIISDGNGRVWLATSLGGLHIYDEAGERFVAFSKFGEGDFGLAGAVVTQIRAAHGGDLLLSVRGIGPFMFDPEDGSIWPLGSDSNSPYRQEWGDVVLQEDRQGMIWLGTWGAGLFTCREDSSGFVKFQAAGFSEEIKFIKDIYEDHEGNIWIVPIDAGVFRIEPQTRSIIHLGHEYGDSHTISSNKVEVVFQDSSSSLWIGTDAGVDKFSKYKYKFNSTRIDPAETGGPENYVLSIMEDSAGLVWAGTLSGGLTRIDHSSGEVRKFSIGAAATVAYALMEGESGKIFLGTSDAGLLLFDPLTGVLERLTESIQVTSIIRDARGTIWFGTFVEGLGSYFPGTGKVEFWNPDVSAIGTASFDVTALYKDGTGTLWIGSRDAGVIRFNPGDSTYVHYFHSGDNANSLSDNHIYAITGSSSGDIWIGTENGLNMLDPGAETLKRFYEGEMLSDNVVCGIIEDENGTLWITSYNGMTKFDPVAEASIQYSRPDGLQDAKFNRGACFKSPQGDFYFGGINGYTSFSPSEIETNPSPPRVVITQFRNIDRVVPIKWTTGTVPEVRLTYDERLFSLEFAALDYSDPQKNRYAYRLVNYADDWIDGRGSRSVTYSKLPPGEYRFEVKGSNNDGVWSETPAAVRIVIVPPFWMTMYFRVILVVLVVGAIAGIYRYRTNILRKQRNTLEVEVAERRIAEGQLLRSQAHLRELAARLTIAEELERKRIARAIHDDVGHAMLTNKLKLIDFIDDLKAVEEKKALGDVVDSLNATIKIIRTLTVHLSPPALHKFGLESAAEKLLETFGEENSIKTVFQRERKSPLSEITAMLFYQSLRELLINILKHAGADTVQLSFSNDGENIIVTLKDNGVGFDVEKAMRIDGEMTHYGLFSIRERMESIGGELEIESGAGEGTTVTLLAPLRGIEGRT